MQRYDLPVEFELWTEQWARGGEMKAANNIILLFWHLSAAHRTYSQAPQYNNASIISV